ncbi:MAG: hypothetical protein QM757_42265 [Paludibaculum sp.]
MTSTGGIVQVSDISVGSGNFDSLSLLRSLVDLYGLPATILEPDQQDKAISQLEGGLDVVRIPTSTHFRSTTGRIEFVSSVAARINQLKPRILIIRCSWNIPVLYRLAKKPPLVIYHATESTTYYGNFDPEFNRHARQWIDVVVFPEENRAAIDIRRCGFEKIPVALAYNSPTRLADLEDPIPPKDRNGRIYYSGALDVNATFVDYYGDTRMQAFPIDIYGYIGGSEPERTRKVLVNAGGQIRYKGFVDTKYLEAARPNYAYSLTIWKTSNENQTYACPCKFFESIASGVPPVTAPHPQPKQIVERYKCGIVMKGWGFHDMLDAFTRAMQLYGTPEYDEMVENCNTAMKEELNWDRQFERVRKLLPRSV